jgi:hypothetical protein
MAKAFARGAFQWPGEIFVTRGAAGSGSEKTMIVYLSRAGTPLPRLE